MRYFAAVARHGGVGRAAAELRIAQPALTRQIHELEEEVGTPLFERNYRGVHLTPAGAALREKAESLLSRLDRAAHNAHLAHEGRLGTVRVGLGRAALGNDAIGRAIAELGAKLPGVTLVVDEVASAAQRDALRAGQLHVAVGVEGSSPDDTLRSEVIFPDTVDRAVLAQGHPLARKKRIEPSHLRGERLLLLPSAASPFPELFEALRRLGFTKWEEYDSIETIYNLIAAGYGWTPHLRSVAVPSGMTKVALTGLDVPISLVLRWNPRDDSALTHNVIDILLRATMGDGAGTSRRRATRASRSVAQPSRAVTNLELRHLRALVAVLEEGSMIDAARKLGITQSGLSRQVRSLEREIDVPLLLRRPARIEPTVAGEVLRAEATAALHLIDDAIASARLAARGIAGKCNIGVIPSPLTGDLVAGVLEDLATRFPDLAVETHELSTPRQLEALRSEEIDVAIGTALPGVPDGPDIESELVVKDVMDCAVISAAHALATKTQLAPSDLAEEPLLMSDRATFPAFYDVVIRTLDQLGLKPRIGAMATGDRAAWRLAADGLGWTLGTRMLRAHLPPGVVAIPVAGLSISFGAQLMWRREENCPRVRAVIDAFRAASRA